MTTKSAEKDYKSMYKQISQEYRGLRKKSESTFAKLKVEANESAQKIRELEAKLEKFQEAEARLAEYKEAESAYNKKVVERTKPPVYDSDDEPLVRRTNKPVYDSDDEPLVPRRK